MRTGSIDPSVSMRVHWTLFHLKDDASINFSWLSSFAVPGFTFKTRIKKARNPEANLMLS